MNEAFEALLNGHRPQPLFVRGEWGSGKTHCLSFVRAVANARGVPSARVDLNARSSALNYPQRFYASIAESVDRGEHKGFRAVVMSLLRDEELRGRLHRFALTPSAGDLQAPILKLCTRYQEGDQVELMEDPAWGVLYGADLSWASYTYKREQAAARIGAVGQMFASLGMGGLVVVFDEAETIDQLWNVRSRMSGYAVLGELCWFHSVWPVFGITERFDRTIEADLDRGALGYGFATQSARWFLGGWKRGQFAVMDPPSVDARAAHSLAVAVAGLYEEAYGRTGVDERFVERCVDEWTRNPGRNPRRLIRGLIHRLDANRGLAGAT